MNFDHLIDKPTGNDFSNVIAGQRLDLIAPFATGWALRQLDPAHHTRIRIITRLPAQGTPSSEIDNNPGDFLDLVSRCGRSVEVYGLNKVHTKLYLNGTRAYYGSSNFTRSGFSGIHESLLWTVDPQAYLSLSQVFSSYLADAERIPVSQLRALDRNFKRGRLKWKVPDTSAPELYANPLGDSQIDFRQWLVDQDTEDTRYVEARFDPRSRYNMTGHAYSAFFGLREFLRANLDLVPDLAIASYAPWEFWNTYPDLAPRLRAFVLAEGHRFPGQGGGPWRNKLPPNLGGTPGGGGPAGGRGSGLIARMLVELSRYAVERGF
jgi:hypothetical protein